MTWPPLHRRRGEAGGYDLRNVSHDARSEANRWNRLPSLVDWEGCGLRTPSRFAFFLTALAQLKSTTGETWAT